MIKAIATTDDGPLVLFGLSHANLDRLKAGQPIRVDMTELGGQGEILIFAGATEATMAAELADFIGPATTVTGMKQ